LVQWVPRIPLTLLLLLLLLLNTVRNGTEEVQWNDNVLVLKRVKVGKGRRSKKRVEFV
jgi:hypothetical protein